MDCDPNALLSKSYSLQGPLEQYCNRLGIPLYLKTPGKHCAVAERSGRTVYEHCTAAMQDAGVNATVFMGCAVRMFEQISRCTPKLVLGWRTPHEVLTGKKPVVCQHRPFAPALIYKNKTARGTQAAFKSRVHQGIYLGCAPRQPLGTFLLLNLQTSKKCTTLIGRELFKADPTWPKCKSAHSINHRLSRSYGTGGFSPFLKSAESGTPQSTIPSDENDLFSSDSPEA